MNILKLSTLSLAAIAALGACSDSVLFEEDQYGPAPVIPQGPAPTSLTKVPATVQPSNNYNQLERFMSLSFENSEGFNLLVGAEKDLTQEEQARIKTMSVTLKLYQITHGVQTESSENKAVAMLLISHKRENGGYLGRELLSEGAVSVKREGDKDILVGKVRDFSNKDSLLIDLRAERAASNTLEEARKNRWKGQLSIMVDDGKTQKILGQIEGLETFDINVK